MYVISIKRVCNDCYHYELPTPIWEYLTETNCLKGCFGLTYRIDDALKFSTKEEAKKAFEKWKNKWTDYFNHILQTDYDYNSLAIRKITFTIEELL